VIVGVRAVVIFSIVVGASVVTGVSKLVGVLAVICASVLIANVSLVDLTCLRNALRKIKTHKRFKRTLFIRTETQPANFRSNLLCQDTK